MRKLGLYWRSVYDVRPGEGVRTAFMALHLMFVLFAYYILKPVSRALFLNKFEIDQLPYLYILIAAVGGLLAYAYTRLAVKASLKTAVNWTTVLSVLVLVTIWWLLKFNFDWMLYVFNIWVSLFSIVLVSQGWLAAANVFDSREAKRLYGLLGMGAVAGAAFGGELTARLAKFFEPRDLLLISALMVVLSYLALLVVAAQKGVNLARAKAAEAEEDFSFRDIADGIRKHRHLQVIMAIITLTFIVDVLVEYQFSAMAKAAYSSKADLTAFLGSFYGIYLNLITFAMQFFLTALVVRHLGVGGTLQIMPVVIGLTSLVVMATPRLAVASIVRLSEAASRYSFNRTGMELLYLPLPSELKNRTKAFVDIFMDRFGRGLGGLVLIAYSALFVGRGKQPNIAQTAGLILGFCIIWIFLSALASREYVATIRGRLEMRRLDLESTRISVTDAATIAMLEKQVEDGTPRQAAYALTLLADAPGYDVSPLAAKLVESAGTELRTKAFEVAAAAHTAGLEAHASRALSGALAAAERKAALSYLVAVAPHGQVDAAWVSQAASSPEAGKRVLAAYAIQLRGRDDEGSLTTLLDDPEKPVMEAACRAAGALGDWQHVPLLVRCLDRRETRGAAIEALAQYGPGICGVLGEILMDETAAPSLRRQVPRALRLICDQRSVDKLTAALGEQDHTVRMAALKALNKLRQAAPELSFPADLLEQRIADEARLCYELSAQLAPLKENLLPRTALSLLARTLQHRLEQTQERLFRLLGLRFTPDEMHSAHLAIQSGMPEKVTAAIDYIESTVSRDLKRVLMHLFESEVRLAEHGRNLFGVEKRTRESALQELSASTDSWIAACAAAAVLEMKSQRVPVSG